MAELYVQKKKNNNWLIWLIVILIVLIGIYYLYVTYYQDNPPIISLFESESFLKFNMAAMGESKI